MSTTEPEKYTLAGLHTSANESKSKDKSQENISKTLKTLYLRLSDVDQLKREDNDEKAIQNLLLWVSEAILPDSKCISYDDPIDEKPSASQVAELAITQQKALYGLDAYKTLFGLSNFTIPLDPAILISLLAFSNSLDPWTTPTILTITTSILSNHQRQLASREFINTHLLQNFIRPLFLKSKKMTAVTSAGRKAMPTSAPSKRYSPDDQDEKTQPWRYTTIYAITIFDWILSNISPKELSTTSLPLILPPLLNLLDTTSVPLRHRALLILPQFFKTLTPSTLLQTTGLGSVFEDVLYPILLSIPSITPVAEAEFLLPPAYVALFALGETWFALPLATTPTPVTESKAKAPTKDALQKTQTSHQNFLTRLLRDAILPAHTYTYPSHPSITSILLTQLQVLIPKMGIHSIKHLNAIIPLVVEILLDPFAMVRAELVSKGLGVLREVLLVGWVRVASQDEGGERWRGEILRGLVGIYRCVCEYEGDEKEEVEGVKDDVKEVKKEVGVVGRMLVAVVESGEVGVREKFRGDIGRLVEVDEGIGEVFGV